MKKKCFCECLHIKDIMCDYILSSFNRVIWLYHNSETLLFTLACNQHFSRAIKKCEKRSFSTWWFVIAYLYTYIWYLCIYQQPTFIAGSKISKLICPVGFMTEGWLKTHKKWNYLIKNSQLTCCLTSVLIICILQWGSFLHSRK